MHVPTIPDLEVPQRSGEVVCIPSGGDLLATARANADALASTHVQLAGVPLPEFREQVRCRLVSMASEFSAAAGIPLAARSAGGLLVVTGHQPFLFHPGIWIKYLMVDHLAALGAAGLSMSVDSDAFEEIGISVPSLAGGLRAVRETLVTAPPDVPYEAQPAPTRSEWAEFLARVSSRLQTLPPGSVQAAFARFAASSASIDAGSIGEFITIARRRYEGPRRYVELPVSAMSATEEFRRFVLHVASDAGRFAEIYNRHLRAYRARANIRTAAQPFPDLDVLDDCVELPFWILREGRRVPLYARDTGGKCRLLAGTTEVAALDGDRPDTIEGLAIRPRALTLTAFTRLCAADLFVHGVGGGRYDRVTDAVIREYFALEPPRYAVLTATLHLPLVSFDPAPERQQLQRRLLELQHNPERVLSDPSAAQRELIAEKWRLIYDLDRPELPRRERREATQRIRNINEALTAALDAEREVMQRRLAALHSAADAESAATTRTYPFCFFPPQAVDALVEAQFPEAGRGP
ncbi:MAG TPA: hypothetical protein VGK88_07130 [bacterium]